MRNLRSIITLFVLVGVFAIAQLASAKVVKEIGTTIDGKIVCKFEYHTDHKKYTGLKSVCKNLNHERVLVDKDGVVYQFVDEQPAHELMHSNKYEQKEVSVTGDLYKGANFNYFRVKNFKVK